MEFKILKDTETLLFYLCKYRVTDLYICNHYNCPNFIYYLLDFVTAIYVGLIFGFSFWIFVGTSLVAQTVKHLPTMQETWVQSLGREDPLEK